MTSTRALRALGLGTACAVVALTLAVAAGAGGDATAQPKNGDELYEQYIDEAAFDAHRKTPHFQEIVEGIIVPLLDKRERELYRSVIT